MTIKYNNIILFLFILFSDLNGFAFPQDILEGPRSTGGGGNVCRIGDRWQLLEFIQFGTPKNLKFDKLNIATMEEIFVRFNIGRVYHVEKQLKERALSVISKHSESSPKVYSLLKHAVNSLDFYWTTSEFDQTFGADFSAIESKCDERNTVMSMVTNKNLTIVNIKMFNHLDAVNQVALVVHEALRQIQIRYEGNGSDQDLQRLTYELFALEAINFDSRRFFLRSILPTIHAEMVHSQLVVDICSKSRKDFISLKSVTTLFDATFTMLETFCRTNKITKLSEDSLHHNLHLMNLELLSLENELRTSDISIKAMGLYNLKLSIENLALGSISQQMLASRFSLIDARFGIENIRYKEYLKYTLQ